MPPSKLVKAPDSEAPQIDETTTQTDMTVEEQAEPVNQQPISPVTYNFATGQSGQI